MVEGPSIDPNERLDNKAFDLLVLLGTSMKQEKTSQHNSFPSSSTLLSAIAE